MSDEDKVTMTTDDIALVRAIVRWRRENDIRFIRWPKGGFGRYDEWFAWIERKRVVVAFDEAGVHVDSDYYSSDGFRLPRASVSQTVDMLVTFGVLPPRFSSAYRAGWDARDSYEFSHTDPARDAELFGMGVGDERLPATRSPEVTA